MPPSHPRINPVGQGDWVRWMLHSFPAWGKTSLLATAAQVAPVLVIRSSLDLMPARALNIPDLHEWVVDTHEGMLEVQDYCRMEPDFPYWFVWWDSISLAQDALLDDIWQATVLEKPARAFKVNEAGKVTGPNMTPSSGLDKGEYGRNMERIQQWVRAMVGANRFHFGITAHSWESDNQIDDEGGVFLQPWIQGKNMIPKICGYCNFITFLELMEEGDEQTRRLHTRSSTRWYAKDFYDAFPDGYLDNPTVPDIIAAIEKARGKPLGNNAVASPARGRGRRQTAPASRRGRGATATAPRRGARREQ